MVPWIAWQITQSLGKDCGRHNLQTSNQSPKNSFWLKFSRALQVKSVSIRRILVHRSYQYLFLPSAWWKTTCIVQVPRKLASRCNPVLIRSIHHPYILPFEQIICWPRCIVWVLINSYNGDHHTDIVPNEDWVTNLLQSLRGISGKELQIRQQICARIYHKHSNPTVRVLDSVVESIKSNMNGWVDPCAYGGK